MLEGIGAFSGLSKHELEQLAGWTFELEVPEGEELLKEGKLAHEFFVIEDGAVEVRQDGERIAELGTGDFFGEIALLEVDRRTATVVASTPVRVAVMGAREFESIVEQMPTVAARLDAVMRERRSR